MLYGRHQFDKAFEKDSTQAEVYEGVRPLITAALEGYNSTIFAYGQTGTGKTHTMLGLRKYLVAFTVMLGL